MLIGWTGTIIYILAYVSLSLGWLRSDKNTYHILNALGGVCLVVNAYNLSDMPSLFVNIAWIIIATVSMIRILHVKK